MWCYAVTCWRIPEVEFIRPTGEHITGQPIPGLITAGVGTRNRPWLQIKADVSGCRIEASAEPEATLLGAALVAGIGSGLYASESEAFNGKENQFAEHE